MFPIIQVFFAFKYERALCTVFEVLLKLVPLKSAQLIKVTEPQHERISRNPADLVGKILVTQE